MRGKRSRHGEWVLPHNEWTIVISEPKKRLHTWTDTHSEIVHFNQTANCRLPLLSALELQKQETKLAILIVELTVTANKQANKLRQ